MAEEECGCGDCECEEGEDDFEVTEIIMTNEDIDELINSLKELKSTKKPAELALDDNNGLVFIHEDTINEEEEKE